MNLGRKISLTQNEGSFASCIKLTPLDLRKNNSC